ncbi:hypothetical protein H8E07_03950 [bacterium]|nr:hypothetical protein [bacterium]
MTPDPSVDLLLDVIVQELPRRESHVTDPPLALSRTGRTASAGSGCLRRHARVLSIGAVAEKNRVSNLQ